MLMKPLVAKECIRRVAGDEMDAEIQALRVNFPGLARSVIKLCIRWGRQSFIDKELLRLRQAQNWAAITKFLHCGSKALSRHLPIIMNQHLNLQNQLNWPALCKFHGDTVLEQAEKEILKKSLLSTMSKCGVIYRALSLQCTTISLELELGERLFVSCPCSVLLPKSFTFTLITTSNFWKSWT